MNYETTLVLTSTLSSEQVSSVKAKFRKCLQDLGCKIIYEEYWGLKADGHWILFEYSVIDAKVVKEFEIAIRRDTWVLRYTTIRV